MKTKIKSILSSLLAFTMLLSTAPTLTYAAQSNDYVDPADVWITANGRTNELDMNATTTYEISYCTVCEKDTLGLTYRVPEYTKSGETALNRGVKFSDGTLIDGEGTGNLDAGTPGIDAYYTGYQYTKSVCQVCGTMNSIEGPDIYNFNKNVYALYSCDHNFFIDFDNTAYAPYNDTYHTTALKKGEYCKFCKGTFARASEKRELHDFTETVDGQLGNNRFYVSEHCADCDFETSEYISAKSVVSSYYGLVDGKSHTVTVSDLSESGVHTSIRYGTSAGKCNPTSAPNYTEAGYYPVYYEIDYRYAGENMVENGVSYVWLLKDNSDSNGGNDNAGMVPHVHDFRYLETVPASCDSLGFERWQCDGCGKLEKRNYSQATGHDYRTITIREANCKQGGLKLNVCNKCGSFHEETTPMGEHQYHTETVAPTCRNAGYTKHTCEVCGHSYITDMTSLISHSFERITKQPTCTDKGYTTSTCTMCGLNYVSDYTEPTGHKWDEGHTITDSTCESDGVIEFNCKNCSEKMIKAESATGHTPGKAATCTEPQVCEKCGTVLAMPTGHHYDSEVIAPTCTAMGYTIFKCRDCEDSYTGDFTDKAAHEYVKIVTEPTCSAMGFTTYTCANCNDEYVSDYTDKLPHKYTAEITKPTCTTFGFTTFTCSDCSDSYKGNYTDALGHDYAETVTAPTCTEMGFTTYVCERCGDSKKDNYTDALGHDYSETVTKPTCTELGYTTFVCNRCGETHKGNFVEVLGHTPTDWIIDVPATIEHAGEKHIECNVCGFIMQTVDIPRLIDTDNSDEDGKAQVGVYSIILTDKDGKPVFDSEITIDVNDNITIKLPDGRLLDYADRTTITVFKTETQSPVPNLNIEVLDKNCNHATGTTDENGQLSVPASSSSTGDDNGTIGGGDEENKYTYVVTVTNKENIITPDCHIEIGESNDIVVKLPQGLILTQDSPAIITVTDQNGEPQKGVNVIVIGDKDYIEKGVTDMYGKVTVPSVSSGYTDNDGKVSVQEYYVVVSDESKQIPNAFVTLNEDSTISVKLPAESLIDYANRITVTVLDKNGNPVKDISVTVSDIAEKTMTDTTDENGKMTVPPLSEDYTDSEGKAKVNGLNILVSDETKPIEHAFITISEDNKISVKLPETSLIDISNRITVTVTDNENKPVKDMSVTVTDIAEKSETELTDENGRATVPPTNIDYTDSEGKAQVNDLVVIVNNETGFVEKAFVTLTIIKSEPDENGNVAEAKNISVTLPENVLIDYANRITVTVLNKADGTPVMDMSVNISEFAVEGAEAKSANGITDKNGKITVPPMSEDYTDKDGNADITEKIPGKDTDGDGKIDVEEKITDYNVIVNDTTAKIENAFVEIKDGKISVKLPDTHTLTTSNQTTVTVLDKDSKPVKNISVTVTDKNAKTAAKSTDANGKIVVPVKSSSGGGGSSRPSGGGGGVSYVSNITNVKITDKDGKDVTGFSKSVDSKGNVTITLPNGKTLENDYYTITVTDRNGKAKADTSVLLKDKNKAEATGKTDKDGMLILPAQEHKAYIVGYDDGTFRPDSDMSRAEAAAIFARLIAEKKGETISGKSSFSDVSSKEWYYSYIGYLAKYNIVKGYEDKTFRPDVPVTRAEFVSMTVRFYGLFDEVKYPANTTKYSDVSSSYWAIKDISFAKNIGWLNGYADGTFKGDNNITRAEVVTVVNRATGRKADSEYINKNLSVLNKFTDLKNNSHWAYYDILESCNTHKAVSNSDSETWVK